MESLIVCLKVNNLIFTSHSINRTLLRHILVVYDSYCNSSSFLKSINFIMDWASAIFEENSAILASTFSSSVSSGGRTSYPFCLAFY